MTQHTRTTRITPLVALALAAALATACGDSDPVEPNTAPVVTITTPAADVGANDMAFVYDGHDDAQGLWYKDVVLEGAAADAEDGALTGAALVWETDRADLQDAALGTGVSVTARLYSDQCTGTAHTITLTATDSEGESRDATRRIVIWTLC